MKIPQDAVPVDLNSAVDFIIKNLSDDDIDEIKDLRSDAGQEHFSVGMAIRNEWSLWDRKTRLVQWFKNNYGISHADDVSGIILDCVWRDVRNQPRRDKELAKQYLEHWIREGVDPNEC